MLDVSVLSLCVDVLLVGVDVFFGVDVCVTGVCCVCVAFSVLLFIEIFSEAKP